jgi:predicted metal-binding membrane protein
MSDATPLESVLKRDRAAVIVSLLAVVALAWLYLVNMALSMGGMGGMAGGETMVQMKPWTAVDFVLMAVMWAVMMVGMMLPSLFATINRKRRQGGQPYVPTSAFALGYVIVWVAFSVAAALLQWGLQSAALLSPMMVSTSTYLGGALFVAAGLYQWTPLKQVCLKHCRSPLNFIMFHWRGGGSGAALRMGLDHGVFCLGCCWVLMGLLFVGGVMNLIWVAAIAVFVVAEKVLPGGVWVSRIGGTVMIAGGLYLLISA